jgi:hypothetical protein
LISHYRTVRNLFASDYDERDKSVILEIVISPAVGIDVILDDDA